MGLDYRYLLFVERTAELDVLRHLAAISAQRGAEETTLEVPVSAELPYRTWTLPFRAWSDTPSHLWWDDPSPFWEFATVLAFEPDHDKDDLREMLQAMLDPQLHLAPALRAKVQDGAFDIVFLTGIGEVFPYIRSHNVLNNLQSVVVGRPMLMFFPGRYEQSDTLGSSLVLFGRLKDDQYYRAKNILEQEP